MIASSRSSDNEIGWEPIADDDSHPKEFHTKSDIRFRMRIRDHVKNLNELTITKKVLFYLCRSRTPSGTKDLAELVTFNRHNSEFCFEVY